ncbi:MAG: mutY [Acidimicrobiaceae bacterium]|nr:mutY [Acidimicrobiaceae bacterium]
MALAGPGEVLRHWSGLGYNRRALNLAAAAGAIEGRHGGRVPKDLASLLALPGVGRYTARAVAAFAFDQPVGVLDTNVGRVLARAVAGAPLRPSLAQKRADDLVPVADSRAWNLALMDFGSLVCRSRTPACADCPVRTADACAWRRNDPLGLVDPAVGSAGTSTRQAPFAGSDRQLRGALLRLACAGTVTRASLSALAPEALANVHLERVIDDLVSEQMLVREPNGDLNLP